MNKTNQYYLFFILCVATIYIYGFYRCLFTSYNDPLERKIGLGSLDGWSLTHIIFYTVIGYMFPDKIIQTMLFGIVWEIFENLYGKYRPTWFDPACRHMTISDDGKPKVWWYGKWTDLFCNSFGFFIGYSLSFIL